MKKIIRQLFLLLCLFSGTSAVAQTQASHIQVMVLKLAESPSVSDLIYSHFAQAVSLNDMSSAESPFVLVVRPALLSSESIDGTPPQVMSEIELNCFLVDGFTKKIVTAHAIKLTGIESDKKRSIEDAINNLQPRDPGLKRFLIRVKEQLINDFTQAERERSLRLTAQVEQSIVTLIIGQ